MRTQRIIQQGAEAIIILKDSNEVLGERLRSRDKEGRKSSRAKSGVRSGETLHGASNKIIIKRRIKKSYRLPELDEKIRKRRTKSEGKLLQKAREITNIPKTIKVDEEAKEISMEFIEGKKLSEHLDSLSLTEQKSICKKIGEQVSKLHKADIIHGDLTTSNMILCEKKIFFIDFGLGYISKKIEDKTVDLHLLKQALEAKHFNNWKILFKKVEEGYSISEDSEKILEHLGKVESRGRYKEKY